MTEVEWRECAEPGRMLQRAPRVLSARKCRLFACASCRLVWDLLPNADSRAAVEVAERFADGLIDVAELRAAWDRALAVSRAFGNEWVAEGGSNTERGRTAHLLQSAASAACYASHSHTDSARDLYAGARGAAESSAFAAALNHAPDVWREERDRQRTLRAALLRDVVGNPFRPNTLDPNWRTDTVRALAKQMYDSRDFSAMPILADALQDADCDNEDVLNHCRESVEHVRGCWVVDLVLGKS